MHKHSAEIYFYLPSRDLVASVPNDITTYWGWIEEARKKTPAKLPKPCTWGGPYNWTIQTFLYLKNFGFSCSLTADLPDEGIVIAHSDMLPTFFEPSSKQFIVEIKPDRFLHCIFANFVIVQNKRDPILHWGKRLIIRSAFIAHWPQPGLIPRDHNRGDLFENIRFMGNPEQFIEHGDELEYEIKKLGLSWKMVQRKEWPDYSAVDAIVAVRPIGARELKPKQLAYLSPNRKPASRLYNAWLAGVPAILSPEIAFQDIKRSELDFLEARDIPDIINGLKQLMADPALRRAMQKNGICRAEAFKPEIIARTWAELLEDKIIPAYDHWAKSRCRRAWLYLTRRLAYKIDRRPIGRRLLE